MTSKKHIVIAGSTGEVGKHLVRLAFARPDLVVHALVRREGAWKSDPVVDEIIFDYEDNAAYDALFRDIPCDELLIALGTTTAKAGVAGLIRVDRDYPLLLIDALEKARPHAHVGLCSAAGADRPRGHYLKAKAAVEQRLQASGLATAIARPSFLLTNRKEFRLLERISLPLFNVSFGALKKLLPHSSFVSKYAPVRAEDVAERLLNRTLGLKPSQHVLLEGRSLYRAD